jgi:hypothetical protein
MNFWDLWCQFVVGLVVGGRNGCAAEVVEGVGGGFDYVLVVGCDWHWAGTGCGRAELLTIALAGEGYR